MNQVKTITRESASELASAIEAFMDAHPSWMLKHMETYPVLRREQSNQHIALLVFEVTEGKDSKKAPPVPRAGEAAQDVRFDDSQFTSTLLCETETIRSMVAGFKKGQFIPFHRAPATLVAFVVRGKIKVDGGDQSWDLTQGSYAVVPAGVKRGIRALEESVVLLTVSPPPGKEDHRTVRAGLASGTYNPSGEAVH